MVSTVLYPEWSNSKSELLPDPKRLTGPILQLNAAAAAIRNFKKTKLHKAIEILSRQYQEMNKLP